MVRGPAQDNTARPVSLGGCKERLDAVRSDHLADTILRHVTESAVAVQRTTVDGHIVRNPGILGGEPIVRGTRISVRSVVLASREYGATEGVIQAYPQLTAADVDSALTYYQAHRREIERYIQANVDDD